MPQLKYFEVNGEQITNEWLQDAVLKKNRIIIIKAAQIVSGMGLKEAKDAVEAHCYSQPIVDLYNLNVDYTIRFFSQWLGPFPTNEEMAALAEEAKRFKTIQLETEGTKKIIDAIECICEHWRKLGFNSKIEGCLSVLKRLNKNMIT